MIDYNAIILFDGVCNFCNSSVNFIIKRDKKNFFKFAAIQSDFARNFFKHNNLKSEDIESIFLIEGNRFYRKSAAVLRIARHLKGFWKLFYVFIIIPPAARDLFYDIIARNRYRWFGKKESCMVPDERVRQKFI